MTPHINISFRDGKTDYQPGDFLICEYQIRLRNQENPVLAIETSVLWRTEGKGETDIGVHLFERRQKSSLQAGTLANVQRISTVLPASPHSYHGKIVKIVWCLRVRLFMADGAEVTQDQVFRLGNTSDHHQLPMLSDESDEADGDDENELESSAESSN